MGLPFLPLGSGLDPSYASVPSLWLPQYTPTTLATVLLLVAATSVLAGLGFWVVMTLLVLLWAALEFEA